MLRCSRTRSGWHGGGAPTAGISTPGSVAPDAGALEQGAEALRAMLHTIAAGVAPPAAGPALAALTRAIEQG